MRQLIIGLLLLSASSPSPGQEYFPYTLMDSASARTFYEMDQQIFSDTANIIQSIKILKEVDYMEQDEIFELPVLFKRNRKEYDSLRVLRDSISQEFYFRQNTRGDNISIITHNLFYYPRLKHHSKDLINALWPTFYTEMYSQKKKMILLGLLNLPDSIHISLIKFKDTPDYIKARLGDQESEKIIVEKFKSMVSDTLIAYDEEYFRQLKHYGGQLLYINSEHSIRTYFEALQSRTMFYRIYVDGVDFEACDICPKTVRSEWALASNLINGLSRYYPYRLISSNLSHRYRNKSISKEEALQMYFSDVERLVQKLYGIEIKIKADFLSNGKFVHPKDFEY